MKFLGKKEAVVLALGDVAFLTLSLYLALAFRYLSWPGQGDFLYHLKPFALIFALSISVFYIAGLYGKQTLSWKSKLPKILLNSQLVTSALAVMFFYLTSFYTITPKTILFIYIALSSLFILFWRVKVYFFFVKKSSSERALLLASGSEAEELKRELESNEVYNIKFVSSLDEATLVIADLSDGQAKFLLPEIYRRLFSGLNFIDIHRMYEDVFDRVPLSALTYDWFLENISTKPRRVYDTLKRLMDIALAMVLGTISLLVYPFVALAIKLEDGGDVFITQERVGLRNKKIFIKKFRSMSRNDQGVYSGGRLEENRVTKVGAFLRRSRIDELPQIWNALKGDISFIGPRPELPALVARYEEEIPYYGVRHSIKPGLSGWAQIYQENHPHHKEAVNETKEKLSFDLYYIKERSLILDLKIALKTIKTLLSRVGV